MLIFLVTLSYVLVISVSNSVLLKNLRNDLIMTVEDNVDEVEYYDSLQGVIDDNDNDLVDKYVVLGKENRQKGRQVVCGHLQARPGFWQLYPTIRYSSAPGFGVLPLKTHQFHHGRENRAQNCLTVSNIKLDDVFPDGFGKAATAITSGC